ncbi:MAG: hypothetical protein JWO19_1213 [Bryobacterales bacterium]|nr:hypothetical protein [Bryobacterales bacterium]
MRSISDWIRRCLGSGSAFVILDQMAVSLGNFATNLVLIRNLEPSSFGIYAVLWTVMLLLNMLQSSLIVHPMLVMAASDQELRARKLATAAICATVIATLPSALILLGAMLALRRLELAVWIVPALLTWQLQEVLRRSLMSRRKYRECLSGDSLSYIGQALLLLCAARAWKLSLPLVFVCMAGTSLFAAAVQTYQVQPALLRLRELREDFREFWKLGRWIANLNLVGSITTTALPWSLALFRGPVEAAGYQALFYITGFVQPLTFSIGSLVTVEVARSSALGMFPASVRGILRPIAAGAAGIIGYGAVLALFPVLALDLLLGSGSAYLHLTRELRLFVVAAFLLYLSQMLSEMLIGLRDTRSAFLSQCWASLACLAVGVPLLLTTGILGAVVGLIAAHLARTVSAGIFLQRYLRLPQQWPVAETSVTASGAA